MRFGVKAGGAAGGAVPDNESDSCYTISPDAKTLAIGRSGQHDKVRPIRLHPLKVGAFVDELPAPKELARQPGNCGRLLFTPDGTKLVAFNAAKQLGGNRQEETQLVVVWNVADGKEIVRFTAPRPAANDNPAAAVSDRMLAIGLEDGDTSLWDLTSGKERKLATAHVGKGKGEGYGTFAVAFARWQDPHHRWPRWAGEAVGYDHGRHPPHPERHFSWIESLAVAARRQDDRLRRSGLHDSPVGCGYRSRRLPAAGPPPFRVSGRLRGWPYRRYRRPDPTVRWWDTSNGREIRKIELSRFIEGLVLSPDGRTVLATEHEGPLRTWDLASGRETTPADLPRGMKVGACRSLPIAGS